MRLLLLAILAAALLLPASAQAATVSRIGPMLNFTAAPGERNLVDVEAASSTTVLITDRGAGIGIDPSSRCSEVDPERPGAGAQCPVDGSTILNVSLLDGNDRFQAEDGVRIQEVVAGGLGNDNIATAEGQDGIDGGPGDDFLEGGANNDAVFGGDGVDLVRGDGGNDRLDGGAGDDRVDARRLGGTDTIDCGAGGSDAIIRGPSDVLEDCGEAQRASLRVPRQRIRAFFDDNGFEFTVRCTRPCAIAWELIPRDRTTRRRIHQRDERLDRERIRRDSEGFPNYLDAGRHEFFARPKGRLTRRDIASARRLRLRLAVTIIERNSLETELTRELTIRR